MRAPILLRSALLATAAVLGACQWPGYVPAERNSERDAQLARDVVQLRLQVERMILRLGSQSSPVDSPTGPPASPLVEILPSTARPKPATLELLAAERDDLRRVATLLEQLPIPDARRLLQDHWSDVRNQAHAIKVLHVMNRDRANEILGGMQPPLVRWIDDRRLMVYSAGHARADAKGFVEVELRGQTPSRE